MMKNFFQSFLILILALEVSSAKELTLIARASERDSYNLPYTSYFQDVTPFLSSTGGVYAKVIFLNGSTYHQGIYLKESGQDEGTLIYTAPEGIFIGDLHVNANDLITFATHDGGSAVGLYTFDPKKLVLKTILDARKEKIDGISDPTIDNQNRIVTRILTRKGKRSIIRISETTREVLFSDQEDGMSYIFSPYSNLQGDFVFKARYGELGNFGENRPDALVTNKGKVAIDRDSLKSSIFLSFRNTASLNDVGEIVFVAMNESGKLGLYSSKREGALVLEGSNGVAKIEYFPPRINNLGEVALRYKDEQGRTNIGLITLSGQLKSVLKVGDLVETDYLTSVVKEFHGGVAIDDRSKVSFVTTLLDKNETEHLGHGLFVASDL